MTTAASLLDDPLLANAPVSEGYKIVGPVALYAKLGQGGMGAVYKGKHARLNIDVVVKVMVPPAGQPPAAQEYYVKRFVREASIAASIHHHNLVNVSDVNSQNGLHYIIMEYVDGESAADRLERKGKLSEREALEIILGAAEGLAKAHSEGIVHRDIKPANIMISKKGEVKVADLGLAKAIGNADEEGVSMMTASNATMGTPHYMSPEQIESTRDVSFPADVWSLGVTLYQLLTNSLPWDDTTLRRLMNKICDDDPTDIKSLCPSVSDATCALLRKCLSKSISDRYPNCAEMRAAVRKAIDSLPDKKPGFASTLMIDNDPVLNQKETVMISPDSSVMKRIALTLNIDGWSYNESSRRSPVALPTPSVIQEITLDVVVEQRMELDKKRRRYELQGFDGEIELIDVIDRDIAIAKEVEGRDNASAKRRLDQAANSFADLERQANECKNVSLRKEIDKKKIDSRSDDKMLSLDLGDGVKMELVPIPAGEFMMGSNKGRSNEKPIHKVIISKPFYMGKYQVTQEQYEKVMGVNPSTFKGLNNPVESITWNDAQEFCKRLSKNTGYTISLPSEAQWEYACRACTVTEWFFGDDENLLSGFSWYLNNSGDKLLTDEEVEKLIDENSEWDMIEVNHCRLHQVGEKEPNPWGLYDILGNVSEMCQDWFDGDYYKNSPLTDPNGPDVGSSYVVRGGNWYSFLSCCTSAFRDDLGLGNKGSPYEGFRIIGAFPKR
ncbi:MAG: bifunctional serine/threonine-protein kinase/formylglycine-generating enzyme family protein [Planctomycetota bacterium]